MATKTRIRETLRDTDKPRVKHIQRPDNPELAFCGKHKTPGSPRYGWWEVPECEWCAMCLTYPGADEFARGSD